MADLFGPPTFSREAEGQPRPNFTIRAGTYTAIPVRNDTLNK